VIDADHTILVDAPIAGVWDYVKDIEKWAALFPGCKECVLIDNDNSRWTIKVGAGGMVKTVNILVHIDTWAGPEAVDFSFKLESEPVTGSGSFRSRTLSSVATEICMRLQVVGSGAMAPMWEAVSNTRCRSWRDRLQHS
jgi:carbon monoxide dehydrogenase subunit G